MDGWTLGTRRSSSMCMAVQIMQSTMDQNELSSFSCWCLTVAPFTLLTMCCRKSEQQSPKAVGYGIPALDNTDIVTINQGEILPKAPKVVMGPGTGLGAAQLMWDSGKQAYSVWPGN
eukprot:738282-Pelagomonas_calceolata.AAC.1